MGTFDLTDCRRMFLMLIFRARLEGVGWISSVEVIKDSRNDGADPSSCRERR